MDTNQQIPERNNQQEPLDAHTLFTNIMNSILHHGCKYIDAGENIGCLGDLVRGSWKQRYLIDFTNQRAYEFIGTDACFKQITKDDIDWESLKGVPEKALQRAQGLDAHFPTEFGKFQNGVADIHWTLNPDGMYYADSDGYGMTIDDEIELHGFIDRRGRIVGKFRNINDDWKLLRQMRAEAEEIIRQRNQTK